MADQRRCGEGQHRGQNMTMPAMSGSSLIVIGSELVLRGLKTILDRSPTAHRGQRFDRGSRRNQVVKKARSLSAMRR